MSKPPLKTALVLSGGSARALTHLGVLQELERHDLRVDLVVGTSMGAIIGSLYACFGKVSPVIENMRELVGSSLFLKAVNAANKDTLDISRDSMLNRFLWLFKSGVFCTQSVIQPTMVSEEDYLRIMSDLIPDLPMENLAIPFAAIAMDLLNGDEVVLTKGSLLKAVSASAAIPGILPPVGLHERPLVDGGWVDNVPILPARTLGADFIIAVDASLSTEELGPLPTSAMDTLLRANEITRIFLNRYRKRGAHVLLTPQIGPMHWANFAAMEPCMIAGRAAFMESLEEIRAGRLKLMESPPNITQYPQVSTDHHHTLQIY